MVSWMHPEKKAVSRLNSDALVTQLPSNSRIGRTSFYKMKKQALGYLGFYFYEIVVPQAKDKRFKPSLGVEEE